MDVAGLSGCFVEGVAYMRLDIAVPQVCVRVVRTGQNGLKTKFCKGVT